MDPADISFGKEHVPIPVEDPKDIAEVLDFVYVMCTIPGPTTSRRKFREQIKGCSCFATKTCGSTCECVIRFGPSYSPDSKLIVSGVHSDYHHPVYECNRHCPCSAGCKNRLVQFGIRCKLMVFRTENKGFGLRAMEDISKDSFVCEYAGEVLDEETAKLRTQALATTPYSNYYILVVKEHLASGDTLVTYVDPMYVGNAGRFINHSCDPNLYMVPVRINNNVPRIALFAFRDIKEGTELTFSYRGTVENPEIEEIEIDTKEYVKRTVCKCGSVKCMGHLPLDQSLYA